MDYTLHSLFNKGTQSENTVSTVTVNRHFTIPFCYNGLEIKALDFL